MSLYLRKPLKKDEKLWEHFIKEILEKGEKVLPYALNYGLEKYSDYLIEAEYNRKGINLPQGTVPCSVYFLFDDTESKILGCIAIRRELNDALRFTGGNIGYSISPSERNKGYGKEMLRLGLQKCRDLGLKRVLLTCDKDNKSSSGVMKANGGIFSEEFTDENGTLRERYWIEL